MSRSLSYELGQKVKGGLIVGLPKNSEGIITYTVQCHCGNVIQRQPVQLNTVQSCMKCRGTVYQVGEKNGMCKYSDEEIEAVRQLYASKLFTQRALSQMFGMTQQHVSYLVRNGLRVSKKKPRKKVM